MTPTPPSPEDDILDLIGLDLQPEKAKAKTPESDFEKELEALFAEELTEPESKAPASAFSGAPAAEEDILLLDDLVLEPAPAPAKDKDDDVLDLSAFSAPEAAQDDDVLDLGVFSTGGGLDIMPPEEDSGGKDGGIDTAALDDLISGLGETKSSAPAVAESPPADLDMSDLLDTMQMPKAGPLSEPADEMLELSLGDLVQGMPTAAPLAAPAPAAAAAVELPDLDFSLPDLSDPLPEALAEQDMGGDLNLSLTDAGLDAAAPDTEVDQFLDSGALDIAGMMEGFDAPAEAAAAEQSLDPAALLDQITDGPAPVEAADAVPEPGLLGGMLDNLSLGDVALGAAAAGAAAVAVTAAVGAFASSAAAPQPAPPEPGEPPHVAAGIPADALLELQEKLAALATQVTGGSVAVVRLEGQLAEKNQALTVMEQRLDASRDESHSLRRELSDLRAQLEETLRQRAQADEKVSTELKERLALVEDRQIQIDRDVRTEIERAVPREAARVIREEIAALAASMHDE